MRLFVTVLIITAAILGWGAPAFSQGSSKAKPLPCVDVQIGEDEAPALDCMNDVLRKQVEHAAGAPGPEAPIDARSPSNQVGTFNNNAAQEQMGNAYGVSSHAQRPKSIFVIPLIPPAPR
jgi:hypothetical protein